MDLMFVTERWFQMSVACNEIEAFNPLIHLPTNTYMLDVNMHAQPLSLTCAIQESSSKITVKNLN